jgi:allantoate deiminase
MATATAFTPGARALARCDLMGAPPYSEVEGQLVRRFLTPAHRAALDTLTDWMIEAGMSVRMDAAATSIRCATAVATTGRWALCWAWTWWRL